MYRRITLIILSGVLLFGQARRSWGDGPERTSLLADKPISEDVLTYGRYRLFFQFVQQIKKSEDEFIEKGDLVDASAARDYWQGIGLSSAECEVLNQVVKEWFEDVKIMKENRRQCEQKWKDINYGSNSSTQTAAKIISRQKVKGISIAGRNLTDKEWAEHNEEMLNQSEKEIEKLDIRIKELRSKLGDVSFKKVESHLISEFKTK